MWQLLGLLNRKLIIFIPIMMAAGLVFGHIWDATSLRTLIVPLTFLMVYPMMVTLKFKTVFQGGDFKAQWLSQLINFGIIPFIAYIVGVLFFNDQPFMALGLLLAGLVPTSGMTISWTGFAKGNMAAAVKMTVIGLTLGSLATPIYVKLLMGAQIDVNIMSVVAQIGIIVFLPMTLGLATRQLLKKIYGKHAFQKHIGPKFPGLSTLGVLGIVFVAMALKARVISETPNILTGILIPLVIIYTLNYLISTWVGRSFLPRGDAIALVYGTVMRNLSIALAISMNAFGEMGSNAALVVATAYIVQVQSAAWYVKLTDKLFPTSPSDVSPVVHDTSAAIPNK